MIYTKKMLRKAYSEFVNQYQADEKPSEEIMIAEFKENCENGSYEIFADDDCIIDIVMFLIENKERYIEIYDDFISEEYKQDFIAGHIKLLELFFDYIMCSIDTSFEWNV